MKTINQADFTQSLTILLRESFEGMPTPAEQVFLDGDAGIFSTLGKLDAEKASAEINSTTIATHAEHARFYIELLDNYLNKDMRVVDFKQSWRVKNVSEDEWDALREHVSQTYRKLGETLQKTDDWSLDTITVALGIVAHTAYHLGSIRQLAKNL
ncbi:MAG: hypothetical protein LH614_19270 [Pyrinomonadaceae bacterium]|nr:hypothetical protein [Pyrinomonadaceae bacterium]